MTRVDTMLQVKKALALYEPLTVSEIARRSQFTRQTTRLALRELEGLGWAKEDTWGWYLTAQGAILVSDEVWRSVPRYPDYQASTLGRIRSHRRPTPLVLSPGRQSSGYLTVHPAAPPGGKANQHSELVHVLVLEAYVGPCPAGMMCRHLDGDRLNNALSNLEWGTGRENARDMIRHGTILRGSSNPSAKLSPSDVLLIREQLDAGISCEEIARRFGVRGTTINQIKHRITWRDDETLAEEIKEARPRR